MDLKALLEDLVRGLRGNIIYRVDNTVVPPLPLPPDSPKLIMPIVYIGDLASHALRSN